MMVEIFSGRRFWVWLTVFGLIGFCAFSGLRIYSQFTEPYRGYVGEERFVDITHGSDAVAIARQLIAAGIVRNRWVFRYATWKTKSASRLQAGEYKFDSPMTAIQVLEKIMRGRVHLRTITFPEGLTLAQMAEIFGASNFGTREEFYASVQNTELVAHFDKEATDLEGYLFPDTYYFDDGVSAETVIQTMLTHSDQKWTDKMKKAADAISMSRHDIITLASIIEMEAALPEERTIISGVFHNRLRLRWRLDADPTVIYGLGSPKRPLTKSDLKKDTPYNTYVHRGLPPGPICNPGESCILAALYPDDVPYFFFVAINNFSHHFSKSLQEHQRMTGEIKRKKKPSQVLGGNLGKTKNANERD